jgi:hypothetical protein
LSRIQEEWPDRNFKFIACLLGESVIPVKDKKKKKVIKYIEFKGENWRERDLENEKCEGKRGKREKEKYYLHQRLGLNWIIQVGSA